MHICPVEIAAFLAAIPVLRWALYAAIRLKARLTNHTVCSGTEHCPTVGRLDLIAHGHLDVLRGGIDDDDK